MADADATHAMPASDVLAASDVAGHDSGHGHGGGDGHGGHGEDDDAHGEPLGEPDLRAWAAALAGAAIAGLVAISFFLATQA